MKFNNQIMLITYADSLGKNLAELDQVLDRELAGVVGGVHILPFFPSSADRGFAPMRYDRVDPAFGTFEDVKRIAESHYLMFDFMINHISRSSEYYKDFAEKKEDSPYKDFFIRYKDFWERGEPTPEEVDVIYKRKPRAPSVDIDFADGTTEKLWCTFGEEQVDLDVTKTATREFIDDTLSDMCDEGASIIRLDAFAYAIKKAGSSCFFEEPDIWELLEDIEGKVADRGVMILPEIHEHYTIQMKIARRGYWIYDFALPVITLNALYDGDGQYLKRWLEMSPKHQFTTLDTHDGIGIVDVKDLMPDDVIAATKERMFTQGANVKKVYNTEAYNNLDIYQVNTTYYSALGNDDDAYLLARAIQFFAPGVPQVYYVGLLAGANDIALLEQTKNGRDINRHYYTREEVAEEVRRPVVQKLFSLMRFRNTHPAFAIDGDMAVEIPEPGRLRITRRWQDDTATLDADLRDHTFTILCSGEEDPVL